MDLSKMTKSELSQYISELVAKEVAKHKKIGKGQDSVWHDVDTWEEMEKTRLENLGYSILNKHNQDSNKVMNSTKKLFEFINNANMFLSKDEKDTLNELYLQKVGEDLAMQETQIWYKGRYYDVRDYHKLREKERLEAIEAKRKKDAAELARFSEFYDKLQKEKEYEEFRKRFS